MTIRKPDGPAFRCLLYSECPITGRPISEKSWYPAIFVFGYQIHRLSYFDLNTLPILTQYLISGPNIEYIYSQKYFFIITPPMTRYLDQRSRFCSSRYWISGYRLKRQFNNRIRPDIGLWLYLCPVFKCFFNILFPVRLWNVQLA
jgi:hypothetical protein